MRKKKAQRTVQRSLSEVPLDELQDAISEFVERLGIPSGGQGWDIASAILREWEKAHRLRVDVFIQHERGLRSRRRGGRSPTPEGPEEI